LLETQPKMRGLNQLSGMLLTITANQ